MIILKGDKKGISKLALYWDLWQVTKLNSSAILQRQKKRLAELVTYSRAHSPYFSSLYQHIPESIDDIRQLPITKRSELMEHFNDWITDKDVSFQKIQAFIADWSKIGDLFLEKYMVWKTSGSTGVPLVALLDTNAQKIDNAVGLTRGFLKWISPQVLINFFRMGGKSAYIFTTKGHLSGIVVFKHGEKKYHWREKKSRLFSVLTPIPELVKALNEFQPALLNGFSTVLVLLAREQLEGNLHIKPQIIMASAEKLTREGRAIIESAFGVPVRNNYGSSEVGAIGFSCKHKNIHINADWCILEPVDSNYQPVPVGQPSYSVLLTNLANYVQPFIRYDLGDSITVSPSPCPCGNPLPVVTVEGRTNDILFFHTHHNTVVSIAPMVFNEIFGGLTGLQCYQIIQTAPYHLVVRLHTLPISLADTAWPIVEKRLLNHFSNLGLPEVTIQRCSQLPHRDPKSGKLKYVHSEIKDKIPLVSLYS